MSIILNLFVSLSITVGGYLFIPMLFLFRGKTYSQKTLKVIAIINSAIVFLLFSIMNYFLDEGPANFGACMLWGFFSYKLMKKYCLNTTSNSNTNNSCTAMNASVELVPPTDIKVASVSKPISKLEITNSQRIFNVIISLFVIASVGINIFLFTEMQRYNSQQDKLIDNVNYLLSSNEDLRKANEQLEEELKKTTWRSKINAFTSDELVEKLGGVKAFWIKSNSKDWEFLNEIDSNRLFSAD